jgi:hypothetical protein
VSNLVPEKRVNKNGDLVTKHVNPDKGKPSTKSNARAASIPAAPAAPVDVVADYSDPFYGPFPSKHGELFQKATTFKEIDDIYNKHAGTEGYEDDYDLRWGAVQRGRDLRAEGKAPITSSSVFKVSLFGKPVPTSFAHAQNMVEIEELYAMMTDEPPGDGEVPRSQVEKIFRGYQKDAKDRLAELHASGVVDKSITLNFR